MCRSPAPKLPQQAQRSPARQQAAAEASTAAMALWRIALTPPRGSQRARPRWLCGDGLFRLQSERAWTVADPATAGLRLQQWLLLHGRNSSRLERLHLVPVPPGDRSAAGQSPPVGAEVKA